MGSRDDSDIRPLSVGMQRMLLVASGLVLVVGIQLFLLSEQTERYFAWTITPPMTAAFLGAAYWASFLLELIAARQRTWARARVAVPAVLLFTTLTLVATLLHLDRFHLDSPFGWVWLAVYVVVPPLMLAMLVQQLRLSGTDPPRRAPLPGWLRVVLGVQAAILLLVGAALFLAPPVAAPLWPWMLTPLTARAVGAWLIALGVAAAHLDWENDWGRGRVAMPAYAVLGGLELLATARYAGALDWGELRAWIYLLLILSVAVVGVYGWRNAVRATV